MPASRTLPIPGSTDLVTTTLKINGTEVSRIYALVALVITKDVNRIPMARITLFDGDPSLEDFPVSNTDLFIPGNIIEALVGYHSDETTLFKGIIVKHSIRIRSNGQPVLILDCKDEAVKLTVGPRSRYYTDVSDSTLIEEIINPYGLTHEIAATSVVHSEVVQFDATDWDFIIMRLDMNGQVCLVDDGTITTRVPDFSAEPVLALLYGATILEIDAEIDARTQFKSVKAVSWDATNQEIQEAQAEEPAVRANGNLTPAGLAEVIGLDELTLRHGGQVAADELQAWADAQLLKSQLARVRGRVRCQGFAGVKPGHLITLNGVGERLNGHVFVSGIRHEIADGTWVTDIQFGISPDWFACTQPINPPSAAGMLPAIQGLQIGIVTKLEADPAGEDRIQVRLPIISTDEPGIWTRVACLDAGNRRGTFFRPEIDDEVIVGFINNDPRDAVVLGMLNSSAKPAPLPAEDANPKKGYVSRNQLKFIFNDDKNSVTLESPAGKRITINEDQGIIQLADELGNKIVLNADGISIETDGKLTLKAKGDVAVEGMNVNLKAQASFKAEGSGGAEVSSGAVAILKGALVQIN